MPLIINDVPIDCINHAAITYQVPAKLILAVMKNEGGRNGMANVNKNGTVDYGVMQINSSWLSKISAYGYTAHDLQYDSCKNVHVGAWILSKSLADGQSAWTGIGDYHSHTKNLNLSYSATVEHNLDKINAIVDQ